MSQLDNINDIALSSEFPTDKIVKVLSGSFDTATAPKQQDSFGTDVFAMHKISHGYTRPVFTKLKWSLDGVNWVDGGLGQLESDPLIFCTTYSTSSDVAVIATLLFGIVHYEVICFWIDDYDATDPEVDSFFGYTAKPFAFDSRLNYQKIIKQVDTPVASSISIPHNLGYVPNAWVYFESNPGEVWPAILGGIGNIWLYNYATQAEMEYAITDQAVNIDIYNAPYDIRVWCRIYGEGL